VLADARLLSIRSASLIVAPRNDDLAKRFRSISFRAARLPSNFLLTSVTSSTLFVMKLPKSSREDCHFTTLLGHGVFLLAVLPGQEKCNRLRELFRARVVAGGELRERGVAAPAGR
jgi:hypothetical protein